MSEPNPTQPKGPAGGASTGPFDSSSSVSHLFLPPTQPDEIGRVGDYRILKLLGEGGMGSVFLAEDTRLQRQVALKFLLPALAASEHGRVRFLREARAAARIKHENVVVVYDVDEAQGVPFIAMERLKGVSLDGWIRQRGIPALPHVIRIVKEVLAGLQAAHDVGLIHRDVKPANIWLEAPKGKVRLLDFGLAVAPDGNERVTNTGQILGTPAYMSPEQARGEPTDHRSDLFSLGVVLYQLATGRMPFTGSNPIDVLLNVCSKTPPAPVEVNAAVPPKLDLLIRQLLTKEAKRRPQSATEVIQALSESTEAVDWGAGVEPPGAGPSAPALDDRSAAHADAVQSARGATASGPDPALGIATARAKLPHGTVSRAGLPDGPVSGARAVPAGGLPPGAVSDCPVSARAELPHGPVPRAATATTAGATTSSAAGAATTGCQFGERGRRADGQQRDRLAPAPAAAEARPGRYRLVRAGHHLDRLALLLVLRNLHHHGSGRGDRVHHRDLRS